MAGIYIHIPFCKTRCIYCDFYSSTHSELKSSYVNALCQELKQRKNYLKKESVQTIYFGGGTPSQLSEEDFQSIFRTIKEVYGLKDAQEITLEANPDDLTDEYIAMLRTLPFNRISIGIQTFDDKTLQLLKRRHTGIQAINAVKQCQSQGFNNVSIDLIYGLPDETEERWKKDIQQALQLNVEHISAYHLTYETGTPIYKMLKTHQIKEVDEESSIRFFTELINSLTSSGYEHYEISNFCKPGMYSRHNTSYWKGIPYLGCGPSAHSFNGSTREWNIASLKDYISSIEQGQYSHETELLDFSTQYNEYIITRLRTKWGISIEGLQEKFGITMWNYCLQQAKPYLKEEKLEIRNQYLLLTRKGIFVSDGIMSDLLYVE